MPDSIFEQLLGAQKATSIGPPQVGTRLQPTSADSLWERVTTFLTGPPRPQSVVAQDPYGIGGWERGAGTMPMLMGTTEGVKGPIKAYHGSPHDFEQFSLKQLGTGEGAQAYGHGLYFAENPETAKAYRVPTETGRTYEVNIHAHPDTFLDWDKPLEQQSAYVRERMRAFYQDPRAVRDEAFAAFDAGRITKVERDAILAKTQGKLTEQDLGQTAYLRLRGREIYQTVATAENAGLGRFPASPQGEVAAAEALRRAGIPGIKYLDQGSRAAGEGTSNYVLFRDDIIEITKKYGLTLPFAKLIADKLKAQSQGAAQTY